MLWAAWRRVGVCVLIFIQRQHISSVPFNTHLVLDAFLLFLWGRACRANEWRKCVHLHRFPFAEHRIGDSINLFLVLLFECRPIASDLRTAFNDSGDDDDDGDDDGNGDSSHFPLWVPFARFSAVHTHYEYMAHGRHVVERARCERMSPLEHGQYLFVLFMGTWSVNELVVDGKWGLMTTHIGTRTNGLVVFMTVTRCVE